MKKILLFLLLPALSYSQKFTAIPDAPFSRCTVEDTVNHLLYVAGGFEKINKMTVNHVAVWNGIKWSPLGDGVNGNVTSMCLHDGILYVGGYFSKAGGEKAHLVAKWDGHAWSSLNLPKPFSIGSNDLNVESMQFYHNKLFVSGSIHTNTLKGFFQVAYWDGTNWEWADAHDQCVGDAYCMTVYNDKLYLGGFITAKIKGDKYFGMAVYDDKTWEFVQVPDVKALSTLSQGILQDGPLIKDIVFYHDNLFIGGIFKSWTSEDDRDVIRYDGKDWSYLPGLNMVQNNYGKIYVYNDLLYIAGWMDLKGEKISYIKRWDGAKLNRLDVNLTAKHNYNNCSIVYISSYNNNLIICGDYLKINNVEFPGSRILFMK